MVYNNIFQIIYVIGLVIGSVIRFWYGRKFRQDRTAIFRQEGVIIGTLASLGGVAMILPLFHMFTSWFDFADYDLPIWAGWIGAAIFIIALWVLWRSHADLGRNWSVTVEIKEEHALVTDGVFRYIRHPMYTAHCLWGIAQVLLIQNWIAGLASLVVFLSFFLLRVPREEKRMLENFGEEYRLYMDKTGRFIPRFWR